VGAILDIEIGEHAVVLHAEAKTTRPGGHWLSNSE
jgi:hypothetical protein